MRDQPDGGRKVEREVWAARKASCFVTYRGTAADGTEAEVRLRIAAEAATLADAWSRLAARHGPVDPESIEIEIRERPGPGWERGADAPERRSAAAAPAA